MDKTEISNKIFEKIRLYNDISMIYSDLADELTKLANSIEGEN